MSWNRTGEPLRHPKALRRRPLFIALGFRQGKAKLKHVPLWDFVCYPHCQFAQLTAASPALRLILAAADKMNAASIEFQTQNGTAAGVQTLCHHLPVRGGLTRCE